MITQRRTRLLRAPDLRTFQRTVVERSRADPWIARRTAVIVPTAAAASVLYREFRVSLLEEVDTPAAIVAPWVLTRDAWYQQMHVRAAISEALLSPIAREVCMLSAARDGAEPPFRLRPGLVPAIVDFYDQLMWNRRSIDAFERLMTEDLEPSVDLDRGARRLLRQTKFLATTYRRYEASLETTGSIDEHGLRRLLVAPGVGTPFTRVLVATPDHIVDPNGLWPADYDLLTRLPGLERIDVVATDRVLDAGFYERVTEQLPEIEDEYLTRYDAAPPVVVAPPDDDRAHFVWRDREEELLAVARSVKVSARQSARNGGGPRDDGGELSKRTGVVFRRPLPYLYLARNLFEQAGIPFQAHDGLPLAAEPYAAAVDLVCAFVVSGYDRPSTVELLRSPHFVFGEAAGSMCVECLDRTLGDERFAGGRDRLWALSARWDESSTATASSPGAVSLSSLEQAAKAAKLAAGLADELQSLETRLPASDHLQTLGSFLKRHASSPGPPDHVAKREERARLAVWRTIDSLATAYATLDRAATTAKDVFAMLRRWIEAQTIAVDVDGVDDGVQLVDPRAASFGDFDTLHIVGLVDGEWPERPVRNIFYPSSLLVPLGWPVERDKLRAERARFADLIRLPRKRVELSTVSLEDDAAVTPSTLLENVCETGLARKETEIDPEVCVTPDDALAQSAVSAQDLPEALSSWLTLRTRTPDRSGPAFRGEVGPRPPSTYAVGSLERYLECPFKYLADKVLRLGPEPVDQRMSEAQRRGVFLHGVFEAFFTSWKDASGGCSITTANLDDALGHFRGLAETALDRLPTSDQAVTRSWMLGSAAAAGLAERLFLLEVGRPAHVVERLTEFRVDGEFVLDGDDRRRTARLRGVVDRIDLISDGTFRVVDYKTSRAPHRSRALQLPLYACCAEQQLAGHNGCDWQAGEAAYAAFGEPRLHVSIGRRDLEKDLVDGQRRAMEVLDRIEQGDFPVRPAELYRCNFCAYPTVCRKDYVGDD